MSDLQNGRPEKPQVVLTTAETAALIAAATAVNDNAQLFGRWWELQEMRPALARAIAKLRQLQEKKP